MCKYPIGKGMFIWQIKKVLQGNPQAIASRAVTLGLSWVSVKVADGEKAYTDHNPDSLVLSLINALQAVQVQVWGWQYVRGEAPLPEADIAIACIRKFGLQGWLIDAEGEYKEPHKAEAARQYMATLRSALPELPIGLCSYRYPSLHNEFPWASFLKQCDFHAPQVYWVKSHDPVGQLERSVAELTALRDLPVVPVGAAYREDDWQPLIAELDEFHQRAKTLHLRGITWWEWSFVENLGFAEVIAGHAWPPPDRPSTASQQFRVTATELNLRSVPLVRNDTRLAVLPCGHLVTKLGIANQQDWWRVSTVFQQNYLEGFVNSRYLIPAADFSEPPPQGGLPPVHWPGGSPIARDQNGGRASPLNEPGQPGRNGTTPQSQAADLTSIVEWLNVEQSLRYSPGNGKTFCNIYAYDYCYLAGVYLPRVWWTQSAIQKLATGGSVSAKYGQTVSECTANSIFQWLEEFGPQFGWIRTFDPTELQAAANQGEVAIICAHRREPNYPGHICAVVPETTEHQAIRDGAKVVIPLQSQAGRLNYRYRTELWWMSSQFSKFGFWKHA